MNAVIFWDCKYLSSYPMMCFFFAFADPECESSLDLNLLRVCLA